MRKALNRYFITGLLVMLPFFITVYALAYVFRFVDGILGNIVNYYLRKIVGFYVPGIGILLFAALILAVGFLSTRFIGRWCRGHFHKAIEQFPAIKMIYVPLRQILGFLFAKESLAFKKAVMIEFPVKGCWSLGFVTNETFKEANEKTGAELLNIFVPLAPNPVTGYIVFVPKKDTIFLDINVKEAMKVVVSGGILNPHDMPGNIAEVLGGLQ